ncbi:MAG: hypothetical protein AAF799_39825 [Myxococcota bacterium]
MVDLSPAVPSMSLLTVSLGLALSLGCSGSSLDEAVALPGVGTDESTTMGADDGVAMSTGGAESGAEDPVPGVCAPGCQITLPPDWVYEGDDDPNRFEPGTHRVPGLLRDPDGNLLVADQRGDWSTLISLDPQGRLRWHRPLPLGCDLCTLNGMSWHPEGELMLSATGWAIDGGFSLLAGRYDVEADALVWETTSPLFFHDGTANRGGEITVVSDILTAQIFQWRPAGAGKQQITSLMIYGVDGVAIESPVLSSDINQQVHWPFMVRTTGAGDVVAAYPRGFDTNAYGVIERIPVPFWGAGFNRSVADPFDDIEIDDRDHTLELFHTFDGEAMRAVLLDRESTDFETTWAATVKIPSRVDGRGSLAIGPQGELYAVYQSYQAVEVPPETPPELSPEPLSGLTFVRWSPQGDQRWVTTVLMDLTWSPSPPAMLVDDDGGIVVASIVDDRLRVERRTQRCACP